MTFILILLITFGVYLQASCHPSANSISNVGIIGGHHILIERAPYMASLRLNGTIHWCGASIVHELFVLTAAHCIVPNREYKVLVGTDNIDGDGEIFEIERINIHKDYNNKTQDYDICLIKLKKPLTFGPKVGKITLAAKASKIQKGSLLTATGWGSTGPSVDVSPKLLQVQIPLVNRKKCKLLYGLQKYTITTHMICAGNIGHDSCQGDSGGPLIVGDIQVGVTSFGLECGGMMPGVYARVSSAASWINEMIDILQ